MNILLPTLALAALLTSCGEDTPAPQPPPASAQLSVEVLAPTQAAENSPISLSARVSNSGDRLVRYEWSSLTDRPKVAIPGSFAPATTITAPEWIADYDLRLKLRVAAGDEAVVKEFSIRIAADDDPPIAEVFVDPDIECGETLLLVGQGHNEIWQGITYEWLQVGDGPRCEIVGAGNAQATCLVPEHGGPYTLRFEFHVRDGVNPDAVARSEVSVECDPAFEPLEAGATLKLSGEPGFVQPLPRGRWEIEGSLTLAPAKPGEPALTTFRFEYGALAGAALSFSNDGAHAALRRFGLLRTPDGKWLEPESSGEMPLGEWPADQPLGFAFGWTGRELTLRWGPPGERAHWPELPFPIDFALAARPRAFAIEVAGGQAQFGAVVLTAR